MWWPDTSRTARLAAALVLAGLLGGCFQPLYGDRSAVGNGALGDKLAAVDVPEIDIASAKRRPRASEYPNPAVRT